MDITPDRPQDQPNHSVAVATEVQDQTGAEISMKSVQQMCRELLAQAIIDGLVSIPHGYPNPEEGDPKHRSAGELVSMANLLNSMLHDGCRE